MEDYKPNSHKSREKQKALPSEKKVEKVVKGSVKKKKNNVRNIKDTFVSEEANNVTSYVVSEILVPTIKKTIVDIITNAAEMIFGTGSSRRSSGGSGTYVSYNKYSSSRNDRFASGSTRIANVYSYDDILFETRADAERVLENMDEAMDKYGLVSVADMCDLAGVRCDYTDSNYGWTNIRSADIIRVRDGWIIKMPKAIPLK